MEMQDEARFLRGRGPGIVAERNGLNGVEGNNAILLMLVKPVQEALLLFERQLLDSRQ